MPTTETLSEAKRILVYGVTGSGKTTMARRLSERTGIRWHSVDDMTWEPGWVEVPLEEQVRRVREIVEGESWILDTAYGKWAEIPLERAEVVVALDYPRWFSFQRLFRRCLARLSDQKTICNGNRETLRNLLSKNSLLLWHLKSFAKKRERIEKWSKAEQGPRVIRLRRAKEAEKLLDLVGARLP